MGTAISLPVEASASSASRNPTSEPRRSQQRRQRVAQFTDRIDQTISCSGQHFIGENVTVPDAGSMEVASSVVGHTPSAACITNLGSKYLKLDLHKHAIANPSSVIFTAGRLLGLPKGTIVFTDADRGTYVYLVEEGELEVRCDDQPVATLYAGSVFGVSSLLYDCARACTVTCTEKCRLWAVSRESYTRLMQEVHCLRLSPNVRYLLGIPEVAALSNDLIEKLLVDLSSASYEDGQQLYATGQCSTKVMVVESGAVDICFPDWMLDLTRDAFVQRLGVSADFGGYLLPDGQRLTWASLIRACKRFLGKPIYKDSDFDMEEFDENEEASPASAISGDSKPSGDPVANNRAPARGSQDSSSFQVSIVGVAGSKGNIVSSTSAHQLPSIDLCPSPSNGIGAGAGNGSGLISGWDMHISNMAKAKKKRLANSFSHEDLSASMGAEKSRLTIDEQNGRRVLPTIKKAFSPRKQAGGASSSDHKYPSRGAIGSEDRGSGSDGLTSCQSSQTLSFSLSLSLSGRSDDSTGNSLPTMPPTFGQCAQFAIAKKASSRNMKLADVAGSRRSLEGKVESSLHESKAREQAERDMGSPLVSYSLHNPDNTPYTPYAPYTGCYGTDDDDTGSDITTLSTPKVGVSNVIRLAKMEASPAPSPASSVASSPVPTPSKPPENKRITRASANAAPGTTLSKVKGKEKEAGKGTPVDPIAAAVAAVAASFAEDPDWSPLRSVAPQLYVEPVEPISPVAGALAFRCVFNTIPAPNAPPSVDLAKAPVMMFDREKKTLILRVYEGTVMGTEIFASLLKLNGAPVWKDEVMNGSPVIGAESAVDIVAHGKVQVRCLTTGTFEKAFGSGNSSLSLFQGRDLQKYFGRLRIETATQQTKKKMRPGQKQGLVKSASSRSYSKISAMVLAEEEYSDSTAKGAIYNNDNSRHCHFNPDSFNAFATICDIDCGHVSWARLKDSRSSIIRRSFAIEPAHMPKSLQPQQKSQSQPEPQPQPQPQPQGFFSSRKSSISMAASAILGALNFGLSNKNQPMVSTLPQARDKPARPQPEFKSYVLKIFDKSQLAESGDTKLVVNEARVLSMEGTKHPLVVQMAGKFQTPESLVLVLERVTCGDLWSVLYEDPFPRGLVPKEIRKKSQGFHDGEEQLALPLVRFYAASVAAALSHLHAHDIAYRNLKPENILIDDRGYIRLVGFGLAKVYPFVDDKGVLQTKSFTVCGTADYMSPEMILRRGHNLAVDCWAFGVLLCELLSGYAPFTMSGAHGQDRSKQMGLTEANAGTMSLIVESLHNEMKLPEQIEGELQVVPGAKELITGLLNPLPKERTRLASVSGDAINTAVTKSPFFAGFHWDMLLHMSMEAPFIPDQLSAFDQEFPEPVITGRKRSVIQCMAEAARSYLESTAASRNATVDPSKISKKDSAFEGPVEAESADVVEKKQQFFVNSKFKGDPNLFTGF